MQMLMNEKKRAQYCSIILLLCLWLIPMSLSVLFVVLYVTYVVDDELDLVQGMNTTTLPIFLSIVSVINIFALVLMLSSIARVHRPSNREAAMQMFFIAIIVLFISNILVFSAMIYCFVQFWLLDDEFQAGLNQAMEDYGTDPSVKSRMDVLHMDYSCCGDDSFKDWFNVPWISQDILVANAKETQKQVGDADNYYISDDVPFSCCDPGAFRPCIHHHVTTDHLHFAYHSHENHTLYKAGCRHALMDFFGYTILKGLALSLLFMFLAQLLLLYLARMNQTSMQNAIDRGDISGDGLGYLFKNPEDSGSGRRGSGVPNGDPEAGENASLLAYIGQSEGSATDDQSRTTGELPMTTDEEPIYENVLPEDIYLQMMEQEAGEDSEIILPESGLFDYDYSGWEPVIPPEEGEPFYSEEGEPFYDEGEPGYSDQGGFSQEGYEPGYSQEGYEPGYSQEGYEPGYSEEAEPMWPDEGDNQSGNKGQHNVHAKKHHRPPSNVIYRSNNNSLYRNTIHGSHGDGRQSRGKGHAHGDAPGQGHVHGGFQGQGHVRSGTPGHVHGGIQGQGHVYGGIQGHANNNCVQGHTNGDGGYPNTLLQSNNSAGPAQGDGQPGHFQGNQTGAPPPTRPMRQSNGSRAFDSLGIPPPQPGAQRPRNHQPTGPPQPQAQPPGPDPPQIQNRGFVPYVRPPRPPPHVRPKRE